MEDVPSAAWGKAPNLGLGREYHLIARSQRGQVGAAGRQEEFLSRSLLRALGSQEDEFIEGGGGDGVASQPLSLHFQSDMQLAHATFSVSLRRTPCL